MKAIISSTNDPLYNFFIPIVTYCWNKLGVDVICFLPKWREQGQMGDTIIMKAVENMSFYKYYFDAPFHKTSTYAQCSRLFAGALDLPEDEVLITSDVDMAVFEIPPHYGNITIFGSDLTPNEQYPICYASGAKKYWSAYFNTHDKSYQKCLDDLLGDIDCENMRGNYWGKDQEELFNRTHGGALCIGRARPGTQFATRRVDRDDTNWRSYTGPSLMDAHLWRPGYTEENFANIMELLQTQYPEDNFQWLIDYRNKYIKLL